MSQNEERKEREFLIRFGVTRNYGAHSVYFEISEQVVVIDGQQRRDAFVNLQAQLDDQVHVYETYYLPKVKMPFVEPAKSSSSIITEKFLVSSFTVEFTDGKHRIKARGGKYEKHGVAVYPECISDEFAVHELAFGVHDVSSKKLYCTVEIVNGQPKRVLSIGS